MKCPKCNGSCRLKMTGAVCLDCNWYTHDRNKVKELEENKSIDDKKIILMQSKRINELTMRNKELEEQVQSMLELLAFSINLNTK